MWEDTQLQIKYAIPDQENQLSMHKGGVKPQKAVWKDKSR